MLCEKSPRDAHEVDVQGRHGEAAVGEAAGRSTLYPKFLNWLLEAKEISTRLAFRSNPTRLSDVVEIQLEGKSTKTLLSSEITARNEIADFAELANRLRGLSLSLSTQAEL